MCCPVATSWPVASSRGWPTKPWWIDVESAIRRCTGHSAVRSPIGHAPPNEGPWVQLWEVGETASYSAGHLADALAFPFPPCAHRKAVAYFHRCCWSEAL